MTKSFIYTYNNFLKNFLKNNYSLEEPVFNEVSNHINFFDMPKNSQHGDCLLMLL